MADKRFGGFWRRLFAYCIDKIILYILSLILFLIGILALGLGGVLRHISMSGELPHGLVLFIVVYAATTIINSMIYFTWFHGVIGQTPGKMLFGLRVIQISGEHMTPGVAFLRWVGYLISGLFLWLGFLWIAFDGRKQGWHDKIAATLVIRAVNEPERGAGIRRADKSLPTIKPLTDDEKSSSATPPSLPSEGEKPGEPRITKDLPSPETSARSPETVPISDFACSTNVYKDRQTASPAVPVVSVEENDQVAGERPPGRPPSE